MKFSNVNVQVSVINQVLHFCICFHQNEIVSVGVLITIFEKSTHYRTMLHDEPGS